MELSRLRAFVEVVRQGGFSQAAKVVFATQSTVSKAVKQLEDELGLPSTATQCDCWPSGTISRPKWRS